MITTAVDQQGNLYVIDPQSTKPSIKTLKNDPKTMIKILKKFFHIDEVSPNQDSIWICFKTDQKSNFINYDEAVPIRIVRIESGLDAESFARAAWIGDSNSYRIVAIKAEKIYSY